MLYAIHISSLFRRTLDHSLAHVPEIGCSMIRIDRTSVRCGIVLLAMGIEDDLALRSFGEGEGQRERNHRRNV